MNDKLRTHEDRLKGNLVWFALGMISTGAVGAVGLLVFLQGQIKEFVQQPSVIAALVDNSTLQQGIAGKLDGKGSPVPSLPAGALVLFPGACPAGFDDLTSLVDGGYIYISREANGEMGLLPGTGAHSHEGGDHSHNVTGVTARLGGGERRGGDDRNAAHMDNQVSVTGTAHGGEAAKHLHSGGDHDHSRVAVRLCKIK